MKKSFFFRSRSVKESLQTTTQWAIGLILLPCVWVSLKHLALMIPNVKEEGIQAWWLYLAGLGLYLLFERLFRKPMWIYVLGHELTHAFAGLLSGAKIHSIRASSKGGEVKLSKTNIFIALAPYVVPLYLILVFAMFALFEKWWAGPKLTIAFQLAVGAALGFHFSLTWNAIHKNQSDLKIGGLFLSSILILLGNTLILGVLCVSLFGKTPTLKQYGANLTKETVGIWKQGYAGTKNQLSEWQARYGTRRTN